MQVKASLKNYRRSARKVREITRLLRGMSVEEAAIQLMLWKKGASEDLLKLLRSAVANAQNNFKLKEEDLYIAEVKVNEGATMKRWRPRAFGRATQLLKRTCHIELILGVKSQREGEVQFEKNAGKSKKKEEGVSAVGSKPKKDKEDDKKVDKKEKKVESKEKEDKGKSNASKKSD
ncbi:MAG: 50S ribosomal protein L22 [Candidatus Moraniibacteriota bacterium]